MRRLSLGNSSALSAVGAVFIFLLVLGGVTLLFWFFNWGWNIYGVVAGVMFGLLIGFVVIRAVPIKLQAVGFGAVTGITIDGIASALKPDTASTFLTSIAGGVGASSSAVNVALHQTGLPEISTAPLNFGLWAFAITLGLVMAVGATQNPK